MTHAIDLLKCSNDVAYPFRPRVSLRIDVFNNNGQGWPDKEIIFDRSFLCAEDLEIETVW